MRKQKNLSVIKVEKCQQLNQREVNLINTGESNGLLGFLLEDKGKTYILKYNTNNLIPLSDFLPISDMSKRLFVVILRSITLAIKTVEKNRFSKDLLVWSLQSTYIDPSTWHTYMMYIPLQPFENTGSLKSFILDMISKCNFAANEDIEYVQRLVQNLNSVTAYTVGMLESYCDQISDELFNHNNKNDHRNVCSVCGSKLVAQESICPFCGKQILPERRVISRYTDEECGSNSDFSPIAEEYQVKTAQSSSSLSNRAISINEDENGVVTIFRGSQQISHGVWLEDCLRAGKILISKFPFRIGKMEGVTDYRILNNTVSRKHADILKEEGKYYIIDLGSTNGTYLNGKRIQPGVKEELTDGLRIKFADSEFKIHID